MHVAYGNPEKGLLSGKFRTSVKLENVIDFLRRANTTPNKRRNLSTRANWTMTEVKRPREAPDGVESIKKQRTLMDFFGAKNVEVRKRESEEKAGDAKETVTTEQEARSEEVETTVVSNLSAKEVFREHLKPHEAALLSLELETMDDTWFAKLKDEFSKPYFLKLKEFVTEQQKNCTVFPPPSDIYSWSRLTPFNGVRVVVIGQDPYHNFNQAHGLAFSVKPPTMAPPSLKNIYKELKEHNYADFVVDNRSGDLTNWAEQGVLLLNTCLTVRAHNANSHSKRGWEQFTKRVVQLLIQDRKRTGKPLGFLLWGSNAINLVQGILGGSAENILVLKSVHPSPLSASRGFFGNNHFRKMNDWLYDQNETMIDWSVVKGKTLKEVEKKNLVLDI